MAAGGCNAPPCFTFAPKKKHNLGTFHGSWLHHICPAPYTSDLLCNPLKHPNSAPSTKEKSQFGHFSLFLAPPHLSRYLNSNPLCNPLKHPHFAPSTKKKHISGNFHGFSSTTFALLPKTSDLLCKQLKHPDSAPSTTKNRIPYECMRANCI
jgi:hypothetical protein